MSILAAIKAKSSQRVKPWGKPAAMAVVTIACLLLGTVIVAKATGWRLTIAREPSLGVEVMICRERVPNRIDRGDIVAFPFPRTDRYYKQGTAFAKKVACMPGQEFRVDQEKDYWCDGERLGKAQDHDVKGRPVENYVFNGKVPAGRIFVMGTHTRSYDSRYWGFLEVASVEGKCYIP